MKKFLMFIVISVVFIIACMLSGSANETGNVDISTTSPSNKLSVNGTIRGDNISYSDIRLKENIESIDNALDKVLELRGVYFDWKNIEPDQAHDIGLIAQEVEETFPEVVSEDQEGYKSINYGKLVAVLVEAVKELKAQNEQLYSQNEALRQRIDDLEERIAVLEARHEKKIALLEAGDESLRQEIEQIKEDHEEEIVALKVKNESLQEEIERIKENLGL